MQKRYIRITVVHPEYNRVINISIEIDAIDEKVKSMDLYNNGNVFNQIIAPILHTFNKYGITANSADTRLHYDYENSEYVGTTTEVIQKIISETFDLHCSKNKA